MVRVKGYSHPSDRPALGLRIGLDHDAVEDTHDFVGATGNRDGFAPHADFGNAEGMLTQDVRFDVVFGANHEQGEDARIGVDLNGRCGISHKQLFHSTKEMG